MYDFEKRIDRIGTGSIKWESQNGFGVKSGLLPFWIADLDFAAPPEIFEAIKARCEHPIIGYANPRPAVYEAIAGWWERRHGWCPKPEWMILGNSVVTAIYMNLELLVPKKEKVLVFTPVYDAFFHAIENSGHEMVQCRLKETEDSYKIDFSELEEQLKQGVKAIIFCNPANPVGRVWTEEELYRLAALCAKYQVYLLSDEVHADFGLARNYTTAGKCEEIYDRLIIYTAMSKSFNMAGLFSCCVIIPNDELRARVSDDFSGRWMFGPGELAATVMEAAYSKCDVWMDECVEKIRENSQAATEYIKENMPQIKVCRHEGTFLMWLDLRCLRMTSEEITKILASEYGIAVGNGGHYGVGSEGFLRFNIACPEEMLLEGLGRMKEMYEHYMNRGEE